MIQIYDLDYFKATVTHAKALGEKPWQNLRDCLRRLSNVHNYRMEPGFARRCLLRLGKDFADHSFSFAHFLVPEVGGEPKYQFNGGIIFYAGAESGVGLPQLSVTNSGRKDARWEINT